MAKNIIRRRKNEKFRKEIAKSATESEIATEKPKTRPKKQKPRPKLSENRLDGKSLLNELEALGEKGLDALLGGNKLKRISIGDETQGTITRIEREILFLDIGAKSEGMLWHEDHDLNDPKIGDTVTSTIVATGSNGIRLSAKKEGIAGENALTAAFEASLPIEVKITGMNKGGFTLSANGQKGFCPLSQMHKDPNRNTEDLVGQRIMVYVTKIDREFSASHRKWLAEKEEIEAVKRLEEMEEGDIISGVVQGIESFGAFIDLNGMTGLLPKRHLRLLQPQPSIGSVLEVKVDSIDRNNRKISLMLGENDPWNKLGKEILIGDTLSGKVVKIADYGLFVEISPGLIGLLHKSGIDSDPRYKPQDHYQIGQAIDVKLIHVDENQRKLSVEISIDTPEPTIKTSESVATLGDLFKDLKFGD